MDSDEEWEDLGKERTMNCWSSTHSLSPGALPLRDPYLELRRKRQRSGNGGAEEEEGQADGSDDDELDHSEDLLVKKLVKKVGTLEKQLKQLEKKVKTSDNERKRNEKRNEKAVALIKQGVELLNKTGDGATTSDE